MRFLELVSDNEVRLTEYFYERIPHYAVLSHTWGSDLEEVSFRDMENGTGVHKKGYQKLLFCAREARRYGLIYSWVDTCCIDKTNNNELSESITSMYRWYRDSVTCYVYLADVPDHDPLIPGETAWDSMFERSRWFKRGFTLQELIAPRLVRFYSKDYQYLGDKGELQEQIHRTTKIPVAVLKGASHDHYSIEERMSWSEGRKTRRIEDGAYCLLGLFGIFMPLLYGEGKNAFIRLEEQLAIISKREAKLKTVLPSSASIVTEQPVLEVVEPDKPEKAKKGPEAETDKKPQQERVWNFDVERMMSLTDEEKTIIAEITIANAQKACFHVYETFSLWRCKFDRSDPDSAPRLFEGTEGTLPSSYKDLSFHGWVHKIMFAYDNKYIPSEALQNPRWPSFLSEKGRRINLNIAHARTVWKEPDTTDKSKVNNLELQISDALACCECFGDVDAALRVRRLQHVLSQRGPLGDLDALFPPESYKRNLLTPSTTISRSLASSPEPSASLTTHGAQEEQTCRPAELPHVSQGSGWRHSQPTLPRGSHTLPRPSHRFPDSMAQP